MMKKTSNSAMKSVDIVNNEILTILNECKDLWYNDLDVFTKHLRPFCQDKNSKEYQDYYTSDEHLNKILYERNNHPGFPETVVAYNLKKPVFNENLPESILKGSEYSKKFSELNTKLQIALTTQYNALAAVYPPGGYISWHNNANAASYNLIFTWSEKGDGYWKHIDPITKEQVIVKDKVGWQCKAFYFGAYEDGPENLVYHMASTDCWRMTISYMFDKEHSQLQEEVIAELELE